MRFLFLESFFGGSHKAFALGLKAHSNHEIDIVTLPDHYWRWRMRGAALLFHERIDNLSAYDGVIATDMINLSDFMAMAGPNTPPVLAYFHENQLGYPDNPGVPPEVQYGFMNMTTALCADRVFFNSRFQMEQFLAGVEGLLTTMPDLNPSWVGRTIRARSGVLYPGCSFPVGSSESLPDKALAPLVIWNHRWEYDKKPERFFRALGEIKRRGIPFRLALLGGGVSKIPKAFLAAREAFKQEIVVFGHVPSKSVYFDWLSRGHIVVSTAIQENFGISVVEAVGMGCIPLLPDRLAYPEIMPREHHGTILYKDHGDLVDKLAGFLLSSDRHEPLGRNLAQAMEEYAWNHVIKKYDEILNHLAAMDRTRVWEKF
ncbi:putative glycosyltransferase [Desulforapulum autotrophicum HRM2]|uniref:tRNA-queuosine alpha-mannosyltransferase n=1 Tax=Desulforapulum autotrophicum (strain ATCC 43914 / DSM 3382 / VKM B-1955 / HRM2) TaxID=177437 RepID=C0QAI1_DESAH|nr:DUF3524 domain-containing protein [Desulforapulum autotrophicum]ACN14766.1 putative glycosyltransferase [Desulforapulum autotrophicum HRM2]